MKVNLEKRTKIIVAVTALLIGLTLAIPSRGGDAGGSVSVGPSANAAAPVGTSKTGETPFEPPDPKVLAEQDWRLGLEWGPHPFAVASAPTVVETPPESSEEELRLRGVSRHGNQKWAVIGTEIVQVGDTLATGHKVVEIGKASVTLERRGEEVVLTLEQPSGEDQ